MVFTIRSPGDIKSPAPPPVTSVRLARRRTLGDEHPDTLDSMINLALQRNEMGHAGAARPLALEAAAAARRMHGDGHEHTLVAISCLGAVQTSLREFGAARALHEEALEARRAHACGARRPRGARAA